MQLWTKMKNFTEREREEGKKSTELPVYYLLSYDANATYPAGRSLT